MIWNTDPGKPGKILMYVLDVEMKKHICGIQIMIQTLIMQSIASHFPD
jgi:hypothetical protein